jgi:hypothetical protein
MHQKNKFTIQTALDHGGVDLDTLQGTLLRLIYQVIFEDLLFCKRILFV